MHFYGIFTEMMVKKKIIMIIINYHKSLLPHRGQKKYEKYGKITLGKYFYIPFLTTNHVKSPCKYPTHTVIPVPYTER